MALANKRRRHAPEQRRGVFRRNHHGSGLRAGRTPNPATVGAAESVLAAGSTVITGSRAGRRSRHRNRSRRRPPVRSRAKGIARDIRQQGRPCILPRRECEANPHALGRANGALASRSSANLYVHPRTSGEKRLLTRGKRSSILQQHVQRALRQKFREQSQSLPRLDHPQLRQPIKVPPDHPQHRHFRARSSPSSAPAPAGAPWHASRTAASKAGRPTPAATQAAATRSSPSAPASPSPTNAQAPSAMQPSANSYRPLAPSSCARLPLSSSTQSPSAGPSHSRAQQRLALKTRDERPAITVEFPQIANPNAERGNRHAHKRATAICDPFLYTPPPDRYPAAAPHHMQ